MPKTTRRVASLAITQRMELEYPCCSGRSYLNYVPALPRERFERVCAYCGREYTVERRTAKVTEHYRVDVIEWTWGDQE